MGFRVFVGGSKHVLTAAERSRDAMDGVQRRHHTGCAGAGHIKVLLPVWHEQSHLNVPGVLSHVNIQKDGWGNSGWAFTVRLGVRDIIRSPPSRQWQRRRHSLAAAHPTPSLTMLAQQNFLHNRCNTSITTHPSAPIPSQKCRPRMGTPPSGRRHDAESGCKVRSGAKTRHHGSGRNLKLRQTVGEFMVAPEEAGRDYGVCACIRGDAYQGS